jgi:hypothetical protein
MSNDKFILFEQRSHFSVVLNGFQFEICGLEGYRFLKNIANSVINTQKIKALVIRNSLLTCFTSTHSIVGSSGVAFIEARAAAFPLRKSEIKKYCSNLFQ